MNLGLETGKILISEPFMLDPNFKKTVVLLGDYSKELGSVGFVMNRPTEYIITDLISSFPEFNSKVYYGGPVGHDTIHFVHRKGDIIEESRPITNGLFWGGNFDKIKFLVKMKLLEPDDIRFFIGYSGWTAGQLEDEIKEKSWIIDEMDINYAFNNKITDMWQHVLTNKGSHYRVIADMADTLSLN